MTWSAPKRGSTQVVFTASALVDLLSSHLGFDDRGWGGDVLDLETLDPTHLPNNEIWRSLSLRYLFESL